MKNYNPDKMPQALQRLWPRKFTSKSIVAGINEDDCAVIKSPHSIVVASTDFLNANPIILELEIGTLRELGRIVVASNLSDLCGSGAAPAALLIGVSLPHGSSSKDYLSFMKGVRMEAARWNVPVVGGDSKLGHSQSFYGVAIGTAPDSRSLFLKNRARHGDILWASGELGCAAAAVYGYKHLEMSRRWRNWAKKTLKTPRIPFDKSRSISAARIGRAGTDISDGLGADLSDLCISSKVGVRIFADQIPTSKEVRQAAAAAGIPPWRFAFAMGGDFQFIVSTSKKHRNKMTSLGLVEIGYFTRDLTRTIIDSDGKDRPLPSGGHSDTNKRTFADEVKMLLA